MTKEKMEILFIRESIEVACTRKGKPGYRWTNGYYVVDEKGSKIYPPVVRSEAMGIAKDIANGRPFAIKIGA